jgi:hypothetical protein
MTAPKRGLENDKYQVRAYRGKSGVVHAPGAVDGRTLCGIDIAAALSPPAVSASNGDISCKRCTASLLREAAWQLWLTKGIP